MSWKDDALDQYLPLILQPIIDNNDDYYQIIVVGGISDGFVSTSAILYNASGHRTAPEGFFEYSDQLKSSIENLHKIFSKNGENWKAIKIIFDDDSNFDVEFNYDDPLPWDLSDYPRNRF